MKKLVTLIVTVALLGAACGSSDDGAANGSTSTDSSNDNDLITTDDGGGSDNRSSEDFCEVAREFKDSDPAAVNDLSLFTGEFFEKSLTSIRRAVDAAPDAISDDLDLLADNIEKIADLLAKYDNKFLDPGLQAEMEDFDDAALDAASDRIDTYLEDVCGIEPDTSTNDSATTDGDGGTIGGFDVSDIDPSILAGLVGSPVAILAILGTLGIDAELAQCLSTELAELTVDPENFDTSVLEEPFCGTTLTEVLSSLGGGVPSLPAG
jgi:hypothetical protein